MLDHNWKRWIAENKLLKIPDHEILAILRRRNFDEAECKETLAAVTSDPCFEAANSFTQLLHKRHSLAMIQRELAKLDPKYCTIERRNNVSREEFLEKYYARNRPVILCDIMKNWKALELWTPEYLKETCGDTMVDISADRDRNPHYETEDTKHRRSVKFADFIDMIHSNKETNDYYMTARDEFFKIPEVKKLFNDIERFPEYLDPESEWLFMWYGPKGTYTPIHHDPMNILLAQVKGRKRIRMIPSTEMDLVYNDDGVYSPVDWRAPDYDKYPKFMEASTIELELAPGEVLFIPVGWWHEVKGLDISISLSLMGFAFPNLYQWANPKKEKVEIIRGATKSDVVPLDKSWIDWIEDNLSRGCDPVGIVDILQRNNFPLDTIELAMGTRYPKQYIGETKAAQPAIAQKASDIDYKVLAEIPPARLAWRLGFKKIDTPKLQLFTLENFLTDAECDALVSLINTNLRPSTVTVYVAGFRTSLTCDLGTMNNPFVKEIDQKISGAMGIRVPYSEGLQAQKYEVGQEFKAHTDFFEPNTPEYDKHAGLRGNRTWTFMIYLNNTTKGGGTNFVNIGKTFYPKKGSAIIWNSMYPDGRPNRDTMHWGMPVEQGEKYVITKWFREKGSGSMYYEGITNS